MGAIIVGAALAAAATRIRVGGNSRPGLAGYPAFPGGSVQVTYGSTAHAYPEPTGDPNPDTAHPGMAYPGPTTTAAYATTGYPSGYGVASSLYPDRNQR